MASSSSITQQQVELVVRTMAETAIKNEAYFSELDAVMGDADFGVSLAGGFKAVLNGWDNFDKSSIGSFLLAVAKEITSNTGGCSGPVWGTLFMRCGMAFRGKTEINLDEIIAAFKSAIDGIMKRGGASLGDKTLVDALDAIVKSYEKSQSAGDPILEAFKKASDAAVEMRETTKDWVAKRGRQSFTGDRSIGTYDPGIVAIGDMSKAIVEALGC
ncbi:MAG: dihydroxyacetone kinase subunit L [Synergistaceae bacterium]|jgi:dihydroxyacetone kinase phosphoprotein-dependent L subunit|nr:dihydroxyacetone kinase subunit L [Synergistaceae bacterium]